MVKADDNDSSNLSPEIAKPFVTIQMESGQSFRIETKAELIELNVIISFLIANWNE